jgi:hypothetical protein
MHVRACEKMLRAYGEREGPHEGFVRLRVYG